MSLCEKTKKNKKIKIKSKKTKLFIEVEMGERLKKSNTSSINSVTMKAYSLSRSLPSPHFPHSPPLFSSSHIRYNLPLLSLSFSLITLSFTLKFWFFQKICDGSVVRSYQESQSESASAAEFVFREAVFMLFGQGREFQAWRWEAVRDQGCFAQGFLVGCESHGQEEPW